VTPTRHRDANGRESHEPEKRGRRLLIALALNLAITATEVIGSLISGSLSLIADAAHNFSDAGSILVSYIAWRISQRQADLQRTFGYARAETVGAVINLTTLIVIGVYLLYEAANRLISPPEISGTAMLIVGAIAFAEDAAAAWVLRKETGSLNVRSTYLHMIADALTTVGVVAGGGAILLWGAGASWIDPAITAAIAIYVLVHAYREIRKSIAILMDSAPKGFDYEGLVAELRAVPGIADIHHLHVWQPEEGKTAMEAHIIVSSADLRMATELKERLKSRLRQHYNVHHATIELEYGNGLEHDRSLIQKE
jgi:cobalt-zinc-cadmium efflux system protein